MTLLNNTSLVSVLLCLASFVAMAVWIVRANPGTRSRVLRVWWICLLPAALVLVTGFAFAYGVISRSLADAIAFLLLYPMLMGVAAYAGGLSMLVVPRIVRALRHTDESARHKPTNRRARDDEDDEFFDEPPGGPIFNGGPFTHGGSFVNGGGFVHGGPFGMPTLDED